MIIDRKIITVLQVNARKSEVMVFEGTEAKMVLPRSGCEIIFGSERMERVKKFRYLGTLLSNHESNGRRDQKESCIGLPGHIIIGENHAVQKCEHGSEMGTEKWNITDNGEVRWREY